MTDVATSPKPARPWLLAAALLAGCFLLYANAISHPFLIDDHDAIETHPDVLNPAAFTSLWSHDYWGNLPGARRTSDTNLYRPVTILTYHIQHQVHGLSAPLFRVVNILLLAAIGWLAGMWAATRAGPAAGWITAAIVVAHPLNTELINHIVGRADLLAVLGVVGFLHVQGLTQRGERWRIAHIIAAVGFALIACFSKESGLMLLPAALVQALVPVHDLSRHPRAGGDPRDQDAEGVGPRLRGDDEKELPASDANRSRHNLITLAIVTLAPLAIYLMARAAAVGLTPAYAPTLQDDLTGNPLRGLGLLERLPAALSIAWHYAIGFLWPSQSFTQVPAAIPTWSAPAAWLGLVVLAAMLAGLGVAIRRRRPAAVALTLWLSSYAIVGNLLVVTGSYAANRLALPFTVALAMLVGLGVAHLIVRRESLRVPAMSAAAALIAIAALTVVLSNPRWANELARMSADHKAAPDNPVTRFWHAAALLGQDPSVAPDAKSIARATELASQAHEARPQSVQARLLYANLLLMTNDLDDAEPEYVQVLEADPDNLKALVNLGYIKMATGRHADADRLLTRANRIESGRPDVLHYLAQNAYLARNVQEAIRRYGDLIARYPNHNPGRQEYEQILQAHGLER